MVHSSARPGTVLLVLAIVAAGCASDRATGPVAHPMDVGPILGAMVQGGLGVVNAATAGVSPASSPGAAGVAPLGCAYAAATKNFVCPTVTQGGVTISQAYTLYDAAGNPQSQADSLTTASIRLVTSMTGTETVSDSGFGSTLALALHDDETVSGVNTGHYLLNGTLTSTVGGTITQAGMTQAFSVAETARTANVALPTPGPPGSPVRWPLSGTVTVDLTITEGSGASATVVTAHEVFTFNGTSTVSIVVTIGGVTSTCSWNFAGTAGPVCGLVSSRLGSTFALDAQRLAGRTPSLYLPASAVLRAGAATSHKRPDPER